MRKKIMNVALEAPHISQGKLKTLMHFGCASLISYVYLIYLPQIVIVF